MKRAVVISAFFIAGLVAPAQSLIDEARRDPAFLEAAQRWIETRERVARNVYAIRELLSGDTPLLEKDGAGHQEVKCFFTGRSKEHLVTNQ